jgi:quercetin 2,3-dioxygenase
MGQAPITTPTSTRQPARNAEGSTPVSTVEADVEVTSPPVPEKGMEITAARDALVGGMAVRRMLPLRLRRSVGAWCFIDHYGPADTDGTAGMQVPPHPHIGLQTVTWLLRGNVLHRDSLGSEQLIRPGQLNLMTSGRGIAHAEESMAGQDRPERTLHGVQLWIALPDASRRIAPAFEHHPSLPANRIGDFDVTVFIGSLAGASSPATSFSPIVGAQLTAGWRAAGVVPLTPEYEHVIFVATGRAEAGGAALRPGQLLYLPAGRHEVALAAAEASSLFLLGGLPLGEKLLMWWNFVARTPEEIAAAAASWRAGEFSPVDPMPAPPLDAVKLRRPG